MSRGAARVTDDHICPLTAPSPHVGGPVIPPGATRTLINGLNAARVGGQGHVHSPRARHDPRRPFQCIYSGQPGV
jgi:uncharacterized Zn-binding protein involved in type VI secretion